MIYLCLCRIGFCEMCTASFYLPPGDELVEECPVCHSSEWLYGVEPLDGVRIRMGIKHVSRPINPGAKSKRRQDRGREQWRQFKGKTVDSDSQPKDN